MRYRVALSHQAEGDPLVLRSTLALGVPGDGVADPHGAGSATRCPAAWRRDRVPVAGVAADAAVAARLLEPRGQLLPRALRVGQCGGDVLLDERPHGRCVSSGAGRWVGGLVDGRLRWSAPARPSACGAGVGEAVGDGVRDGVLDDEGLRTGRAERPSDDAPAVPGSLAVGAGSCRSQRPAGRRRDQQDDQAEDEQQDRRTPGSTDGFQRRRPAPAPRDVAGRPTGAALRPGTRARGSSASGRRDRWPS